MSAQIIEIAEEIKNVLNSASFSESFTATRTFVKQDRLESITSLEVWVQPTEMQVTPANRDHDRNEYVISIGIFKKCDTDIAVDEMITLIDEIYRYFRRYKFTDNSKNLSVELPTLFSPDYLFEMNLFAGVITLRIVDIN
jgi:hypothetical protein